MSNTTRRGLVLTAVIAGALGAVLWAVLGNWVSASICAGIALAGVAFLIADRRRRTG